MYENIAAMICSASAFKSDSIEYKGALINVRACDKCDTFNEENSEHIIMQCEKHTLLIFKTFLFSFFKNTSQYTEYKSSINTKK